MRVAVLDNYLYIGSEHAVEIYSISNPNNPQKVNEIYLDATLPSDIVVHNNRLYVSYTGWLKIYSLLNPANPSLIGSKQVSVGQIFVLGNYAYASGPLNTLNVYDISNPSNIITLGVINILPQDAVNVNTNDIYVTDNYAYVVTDGHPDYDELFIVNVTDPSSLNLVGSAPISGAGAGVFVKDNYAYTVGTFQRMEVFATCFV